MRRSCVSYEHEGECRNTASILPKFIAFGDIISAGFLCDFYLTALASSKEDCTLNVSVYMHTNHNKYIVFEKHPIPPLSRCALKVAFTYNNFLVFFAFPIFYSLIHISVLCLTSHHY